MKFQIIYITVSNKGEAEKIASVLLNQKLCACVNIIENVTSFFFWKDKIQKEKEVILLAKTTENLTKRLIETVKKKHSYSCPCVVSVPILDGNPDFLQWIQNSTKS